MKPFENTLTDHLKKYWTGIELSMEYLQILAIKRSYGHIKLPLPERREYIRNVIISLIDNGKITETNPGLYQVS